MALPRILKDYNLFGDGHNWQGLIPTLTLPELTRRMVEYEGGGMDGPVEIDLGQENIEFEWSPGGLLPEIFGSYGSPIHDTAMLRFVGSYESDEDGEVVPVEIVVRGRHKTIGMGEASKGDANTQSVTTTCSYYKLTINGQVKIEIDKPGYVFIVDGTDRLAERRQALGL
ncbi:phage major tail tube protein [Halomonas binhaiensis]|uniref:Phage major tail tube protein n=1 Tax=Halomonas binhaiensis TaxID=2562282 RepID=A0A5C1NDS2_9GAMM|nr:phage major tail tube protein [Halomonas binhaiensis]QEM80207.1 phage major tail tube protein [Halomonas binhaiensis]